MSRRADAYGSKADFGLPYVGKFGRPLMSQEDLIAGFRHLMARGRVDVLEGTKVTGIEGQADDFIVATKCFGAMSARPWDQGLSRKHILDAIEGSLRRLGTDYVDLYQLHHPDPSTPMDESLRALDDIVRAARRATSAARTTSRIRSPARSGAASTSVWRASTACSPATTCSSARSSASSSRCAPRKVWA